MNRRLVCLLATLLALAAAGPWQAEAEPLITLVSQEYSYSFVRQIHFEAEFSSVSPITGVTLFFAAQDDLRVFHAELPVAGDQTKTGAGYTLDLAEYPLRPFARVEFWWRVETRDGSVLETAPAAFIYADNRYDWQRVADEDFQIYWAAEDPGLGHTALRIARDGLERIGTILPDALAQPATIYIYPSLDDYRSALQLAGLEWIGGHADLEWDVILLSAAGGPNGSTELQKKIPHEIAHYVIGQRAGGGSNQVPYWLHEGLAVGNEPWPDPALTLVLQQAAEDGSLLSLETLCGPPPDAQPDALLFYAQSASVVRYLRNHHGDLVIRQLLAAYADGADCGGGVERILGMPLEQLEADWFGNLSEEGVRAAPYISDPAFLLMWIGLVGGGTALASTFYLARPRNDGGGERHELPT